MSICCRTHAKIFFKEILLYISQICLEDFLHSVFNCSQTKFVAIILVLSFFFMQISAGPNLRLTHLTFCPQKRFKQVAPSGPVLIEPFSSLVFKYAIHRVCFGDLYLWCEGRFLEIDSPTHTLLPPPTNATPSAHRCTPLPLCSPTPLQLS